MGPALIVSIIALVFALLSIIALFKVFLINRSFTQKIDSQNEFIDILQQQVKGFSNELDEVRSGTFSIVNRIKELELQVTQVKTSQQTIAEQEPQSRFYNKGVKLVSQGASIDELMQECEIPLAEAELLFNLHNQKK